MMIEFSLFCPQKSCFIYSRPSRLHFRKLLPIFPFQFFLSLYGHKLPVMALDISSVSIHILAPEQLLEQSLIDYRKSSGLALVVLYFRQ